MQFPLDFHWSCISVCPLWPLKSDFKVPFASLATWKTNPEGRECWDSRRALNLTVHARKF